MTVKELIEKLEQMPQNAIVVADTGEGERYCIRQILTVENNTKVLLDE